MSDRQGESGRIGMRRLLLAIDSGALDAKSLDDWIVSAVDFAGELGLEVHGVVIESEAMVRWLSAPGTLVVGSFSAKAHVVDPEALIRAMRAQAEHVRKRLRQRAESLGIRWAFQLVRGTLARQLAEMASEHDLVATRSGLRKSAELQACAHARLLWVAGRAASRDDETARSVAVQFEGSEASARALAVAYELALRLGLPLRVLSSVDRDLAARALRDIAAESATLGGVDPTPTSEARAMAFASRADITVVPSREAMRTALLRLRSGIWVAHDHAFDPSELRLVNGAWTILWVR